MTVDRGGGGGGHGGACGSSSVWTKRFRIKSYTNAFVIEVNLAHYQDPIGDCYDLSKEPTHKELTDELVAQGGPVLIIFRDRLDMIELVHSTHLVASDIKDHLGHLECSLQVHAILGVMPLKGRRFLLVVPGQELIASIPPDCSPLGVWHKDRESLEAVHERCAIYPRHRNIFVITNVIALPFHVPTDVFLSSKLLKTAVYTPANTAAVHADGGMNGPQRTTNSNMQGEIDLTVEDLLGSSIASVINEVERMLSKGIHFFSFDCDLTRSLQNQYDIYLEDGIIAVPQKVPCWTQSRKSVIFGKKGGLSRSTLHAPSLMDYAEPCFVWNTALCAAFDQNSVDRQWTCPIIQGSVSATKINTGEFFLWMMLISRRSSYRGGTRYFARGLDENGYAANFCEAEMLCSIYKGAYGTGGDGASPTQRLMRLEVPFFPSSSLSNDTTWGGWWAFRQLRGSAPCFWDQLGFSLNPQPRINGNNTQNLEVFSAHQKLLEAKYGHIHYVDLLSPLKLGEAKVSQFVKDLMQMELEKRQNSGFDLIGHGEGQPVPSADSSPSSRARVHSSPVNHSFSYSDWDFHRAVQSGGFEEALKQFGSRSDILDALADMGYFHTTGPEIQCGVFRTNCLDCLDRTTVIQWYLCERAFLMYLIESDLTKLVNLQGVKYSQDTYIWLLRKMRSTSHANSLSAMGGANERRKTFGATTGNYYAGQAVHSYDNFDSADIGDVFSQQFRRDCEPMVYQLPQHSKRPFQYPLRKWCPNEPLAPQPPFPATSVLPYFSFGPNMSGEKGSVGATYLEARIYFVGGWTNDRLLTVFFKCPLKYVSADNSHANRINQLLHEKAELSPRSRRHYMTGSKWFVKTWWTGQDNNLQTLTSGKDLPAIVPMALPVDAADGATESSTACCHVVKDGVSSMWADAGDLISVAYTGTASVLTPLLKSGRATILTNLTHLKRSVGRLYKHTFEDKAKQEAIDALVGTACAAIPSSIDQSVPRALQNTTSDQATTLTQAALTDKFCSIWVGTWNTGGGSSLSRDDLSDWFVRGVDENVELFLVAFQEIVELASISTVLNTRNKARESDAVNAINRVAAVQAGWQVASVKTLVGVTSVVLVRNDCATELSEVDTYVIKMGILGQVGNKGAVVTYFTFRGRSLSFCNVHFNPDKNSDKTQERLNQFEKLFNTQASGNLEGPPQTSIRENDYWFLAGDFNCPAMASVAEIEKWLHERKFAEFFQRDQLSWLRNLPSAGCMRDVSEATVSFWPTYKYKKGTSTYDRKRAPSWCDRVLYGGIRLNSASGHVQTLRYDRIKSILSSDHRPVYFLCSIYEAPPEDAAAAFL